VYAFYRDGEEYEREQAQVRRHRSAMQTLLGEANIRIRVKPPGRDYMHLKVACIDGRLLRAYRVSQLVSEWREAPGQ
jgi:hypothetical protein